MIWAVGAGNYQIVQLLVESGANINIQETKFGTTAIHISISKNYFEIFNYLLRKNAKIDIKTNAGQDVLMLAKSQKKDKFVDVLRNHQKW